MRIRIPATRLADAMPAPPHDAPPAGRSFYIWRGDIGQHGFTPGRKGCTELRMQKAPQGRFR